MYGSMSTHRVDRVRLVAKEPRYAHRLQRLSYGSRKRPVKFAVYCLASWQVLSMHQLVCGVYETIACV